MSWNELEHRSPTRRYQYLGDGGADGVGITNSAGGFKLAEQYVAGSDVSLKANNIKCTLETI